MARRLVLDLDRCGACRECTARCDVLHRPGGDGEAVTALREEATFALVCRRCEHAACAAACPAQALERRPDGVMVRHNLRCVSCGSCVVACPFGTILPELVAFYVVPCDRCASATNGTAPPCAGSCTGGALEWRETADDEPDLHVLSEPLAVRAVRWRKREGAAA